MTQTDYMYHVMKLDKPTAFAISDFIVMSSLSAGFVGAFMSDGYCGQYRTVMIFTPLFFLSTSTLCWSSAAVFIDTDSHAIMDSFLFCVIFITGTAIIPAYIPLILQQLQSYEKKAIYYIVPIIHFVSNAAGVLAGIIFPKVNEIYCYYDRKCYPATFGFATAYILLGFCCFAMGTFHYKTREPTHNPIIDAVRIYWKAIKNYRRSLRHKVEVKPIVLHPFTSSMSSKEIIRNRYTKEPIKLLDYYMDTHKCNQDELCVQQKSVRRNSFYCQKLQFIEDIHVLTKFVALLIPLTLWWIGYQYIMEVSEVLTYEVNIKIHGFMFLPEYFWPLYEFITLATVVTVYGIVYPVMRRLVHLNFVMRIKWVYSSWYWH
ncbi:unnamed protein product [Bursaphelenchus okinawaensis]|uniref:Uncharacterized protein n=1 Tax=Bursaphelenchus okinawaensis TaxID=465554 RepID=A0A811KP73_9BILA|nr:unnamed protein product [Bursaphelenchus okinawaensis]CAG9107776.1 unnamed protein product [Bursaphelenchus okinawaensis]